ncbi:MAG: integrase core domain-containing protein [Comamonas sp.]
MEFCLQAIQEAFTRWGAPAIFNTDHGSQFTSDIFTAQLQRHGIRISIDDKGAWRDNILMKRLWRSIKYEDIYLKTDDSVRTARCGITQYQEFYNSKGPIRHMAKPLLMRRTYKLAVCAHAGDIATRISLNNWVQLFKRPGVFLS